MCFFLNATSPPGIYSLSLHDALPILATVVFAGWKPMLALAGGVLFGFAQEVSSFATTLPAIGHTFPSVDYIFRSEEHTSELQSHSDLVCRLLLEKKKKKT